MPIHNEQYDEGDVFHHPNGEHYRVDHINGNTVRVTQLRNRKTYEWTVPEARDMARPSRVRSETSRTSRTVTDIDDLDEGTTYRYEHAKDGDTSRTFTVRLDRMDAENFADYGEGAIQFRYSDGYVADLPVSKVERQIEAHMIEVAP